MRVTVGHADSIVILGPTFISVPVNFSERCGSYIPWIKILVRLYAKQQVNTLCICKSWSADICNVVSAIQYDDPVSRVESATS
jgi:hypothetical protein